MTKGKSFITLTTGRGRPAEARTSANDEQGAKPEAEATEGSRTKAETARLDHGTGP